MIQEPIGNSIKEAFLFLKPIFSDTARVMKIVEDAMNNRKLSALWGAASVWGRSYAYYGDYGWLTHYLTRLFVNMQQQKDEKISFKEKKGAFVNVYFAPETLTQPIVLYGVIQSKDENIWPIWQSLLAVNSGPQFIINEKVSEWSKYEDDGYLELDNLIYKVIPLVELNNKESIVSMCNETVEKFNDLAT